MRIKLKENKKIIIYAIGVLILIGISSLSLFVNEEEITKAQKLEGTILKIDNSLLTIKDNNNNIYTFDVKNINANVGSEITIEYTGILDENKELQNTTIINYTTTVSKEDNKISTSYLDNGIFNDYYKLAYNKLQELSTEEKIAQILLVRYPDANQKEELKKYGFGGYIFFEKDFKNKTKEEVQDMIKSLQKASKIPILTAVDEEGGKVVRISSNPNLASSKFLSPKELYNLGGFEKIKEDTKEKSKLLKSLEINLNLAPVVDVSTNSNDYIYERTLGENTALTSNYAKAVIEASKNTGVSYTLKHFPGYGNNTDTHTGSSTDQRTIEDIKANDLPPFTEGINAGAEAILVSHNIVTSIDPNSPASLSPEVHSFLRNDLGFTGVIITDDLSMGAVSQINNNTVKAIQAGNDLIITTDYKEGINDIKNALQDEIITEKQIDKLALRILAWKYYKGLIPINQK